MSLLTVVIPTYNRADVLRETLEIDLEMAAGLPVEFVVVDDGSSDSTVQVLKELSQRFAQLRWISVPNRGPGLARNQGAALGQGDLILFTGDDIRPRSPGFFTSHLEAHARFPQRQLAVLGKIAWPRAGDIPVNLVMQRIQGSGAEQFCFYHLKPYSWVQWFHFYTSNISVKKRIVDDWHTEGFSPRFQFAAWEDIEFAYRMTKKVPFNILYVPGSVGDHHHAYTLSAFFHRQVTAGMAAHTFLEIHPEVENLLPFPALLCELRKPVAQGAEFALFAEYAGFIEGIKAYGSILEATEQLGSQNWHHTFLGALFQLALDQGLIAAYDNPEANLAAAYRLMLQRFANSVSGALESEVLGQYVHLLGNMLSPGQPLTSPLDECRNSLGECRNSLDECRNSLAECLAARAALEERLTWTLNSLSWRLSAPLRWAGNGITRLIKKIQK